MAFLKNFYPIVLLFITLNSHFAEDNLLQNISENFITKSQKIPPSPIDGMKLYELKQYSESIFAFKNFLQKYPKDFKSLQYLILNHIKLNQINKTRQYLSGNTSTILPLYSSVIEILMNKREWDHTIAFIQNVLEIHPNEIQILNDYFIVLRVKKMQKETIFIAHKIVNLISEKKHLNSNQNLIFIKTLSQLGLFYLKKSDTAKSITMYEKLKTLYQPNSILQMNNILLLSSLYLQVGRSKDAHAILFQTIRYLQKNIEHPEHPTMLLNDVPNFLLKYYLSFLRESIYFSILLRDNDRLISDLKRISQLPTNVIQKEPLVYAILLVHENELSEARSILSQPLRSNSHPLEILVSSLVLLKITSDTRILYELVQKMIYSPFITFFPNILHKINQKFYKYFKEDLNLKKICENTFKSNIKIDKTIKSPNHCTSLEDILLQYLYAKHFFAKENFSYFIWYAHSILQQISIFRKLPNIEKEKNTNSIKDIKSNSNQKRKKIFLSIEFDIYSTLGYIYANKKNANLNNLKLSKYYYELLIKKFPNNLHVHLVLIDFLHYKFKPSDNKLVSEYLKNVFIIAKKQKEKIPANAYFYQALILEKINDVSFKEFEFFLEKAIQEDPYNANFLNYLGYTYVLKNVSLEQAEIYIQDAITLDPNNAAYLDSMGWLLYQKKEYQKSIFFLQKAQKYSSNNENILVISFHLGKTYEKLKKLDKALNYYKKSLIIMQNVQNKYQNDGISKKSIKENIQNIEKMLY